MGYVILTILIFIAGGLWFLNEKYDIIEEVKIKREFKKKYQVIHEKYKSLLK